MKNLIQLLGLQRTKTRTAEPRLGRTPWDWTQAGNAVSPDTALTISAVWRCTGFISQSIAALPWQTRQLSYGADGRPASKVLPDHPVSKVLRTSANPEMSAFTFREQMYASALNWGNGYAEIERDSAGRVINLWFISPDRVDVKRDKATGKIYYDISDTENGPTKLWAEDMLHLHGLGFDGLAGYSIIAYASRTMGLNMALEDYGSSLFGNGATPSGVLSHPGKLNKAGRQRLRESWDELLKGAKKSLKTVVLDEGMLWNPTALPNDSAQFLESRKFSVVDVCRWYGVPPNKVFDWDKSTYNNFEQANREVIIDTLLPWIRRFEEEVDRKLLGNNYNGNYSKMEVRELLRGDPKSRGAFYLDMFRMASISPNEVRHYEDLNPIEGGDRYFIQANNLVPLDRIDDLDRISKPGGIAPSPEEEEEVEEVEEVEEELEEIEASLQQMINMEDDEQLSQFIDELIAHETGV
ncbi:MAG: phage portal protein, partial [Candidatus Electrothrix sp.]